MLSRRALFLVCVLASCTPAPAAPKPLSAPLPSHHSRAQLVVLGDLQRTSVLEAWRERNPRERKLILEAVAAVAPDLVAFTGDLVFDGGSDDHWDEFERLSAPIRKRKIPAITAFGNHEYWRGRGAAERNVFRRFPRLEGRHWYEIDFGPLRLVVVDSNDKQLSKAEWQAQRSWYERTLRAADESETTRGVFVLMHHPPYTNSKVTHDEQHVQDAFEPEFMAREKTLAFLTGHVHSYERFVRRGKTFVVSGGGGGPRHELARGDRRPHPDDQFDRGPLRDFHFTIYTLGEQGISAQVRGLGKGETQFYEMDRFRLRYASDSAVPIAK
jgi:3',5'-cyclic AMP phosphodiesterase CpdA